MIDLTKFTFPKISFMQHYLISSQVYVLWLHLLFVTLIPFIVLLWLNKIIHKKLSKGLISMRRTGHETLRRREVRLARVSLGIVLLYMVCHSPKLVPTVCEIVYGDAKVDARVSLDKSVIE
jgi:hypothetical protein